MNKETNKMDNINPNAIGTFGISFSRDLDQTWFNMWRKENWFDTYLYENVEGTASEGEPVDIHKQISIEEGDKILSEIMNIVKTWKSQYRKDDTDGMTTNLNWTIDADDNEDQDIFMLSGNWKMPEDMTAVIEVIRKLEKDFGKCLGL